MWGVDFIGGIGWGVHGFWALEAAFWRATDTRYPSRRGMLTTGCCANKLLLWRSSLGGGGKVPSTYGVHAVAARKGCCEGGDGFCYLIP